MSETFRLYWTAEDGQSDLPMGEFQTRAAAEAAIPSAIAELLDNCAAGEGHEERIRAGRWSIDETKDR